MPDTSPFDPTTALAQLDAGLQQQKLTAGAAENIREWLTEPRYAPYAPEVAGTWPRSNGRNWTTSSGRSFPSAPAAAAAQMYPIGSNAINDRTIGESAQGLADYVAAGTRRPTRLVLRDRLRHAAPLAAFRRAVRRDHGRPPASRSTSSTAIAARRSCRSPSATSSCSCGIMVTASHNPPSDNAVKVYWSTGGQLLPPHDRGDDRPRDERRRTSSACRLPRRWPTGKIVYLPGGSRRGVPRGRGRTEPPGPRDLKIIYSPLHGVGASAVLPGAGGRRLHRRRSVRPARRARRRFSQRARPRLQSGESQGLRRDHRARQADRRRSDPGHRSRLRSHRLRRAADAEAPARRWATLDRQPDRRAADRLSCSKPAAPPARSRPSTTSSRRWSPRS